MTITTTVFIIHSKHHLLTFKFKPNYMFVVDMIGENWNGFMYSINLENSAPDCDPNPDSHPENFTW